MKCVFCLHNNPKQAKYCSQCGKKLNPHLTYLEQQLLKKKAVCWNCGKKINFESIKETFSKMERGYCTNCGAKQNISTKFIPFLKKLGKGDKHQAALWSNTAIEEKIEELSKKRANEGR